MTKNNYQISNDQPIQFITFGCRLNHYETAQLQQSLQQQLNYSNNTAKKPSVIINSCAVTAETERQIRQTIRKLYRQNPQRNIIVTGCSAQINPDIYQKMPEVNRILGNAEKLQPELFLNYESDPTEPPTSQMVSPSATKKSLVADIFTLQQLSPQLLQHYHNQCRAFLEIQNGCDHRCTFCVIPYGRGNSRSHKANRILAEARQLNQNGFQEIILTGVDLTSWRDETGKKLPYLLKTLLQNLPNLPRLRLSSVDPAEIDDEMIKLFEQESRLLPHLHLSLQSGNDLILKRMKRRHLAHQVRHLTEKLLSVRPDIIFGADVIVGFPTETEEMFQDTINLVREIPITYLHVFPYSNRPFTPANKITKQIPIPIRKQRAKLLRQIASENWQYYLKNQLGKNQSVLVEKLNQKDHKIFAFGYNAQFCPVTISFTKNQTANLIGKIIDVTCNFFDNHSLQCLDNKSSTIIDQNCHPKHHQQLAPNSF